MLDREQEAKELEVLKEAIKREKLLLFDILRNLDRADDAMLAASGYRGKTNAEACREAYRACDARIKKLANAHIKKYPD